MALSAGNRLGPYEIVAPLGAGGMGEVYRAKDSKLNREVAIKVLPAAVAQDAERLVRFRREAQVLASLNHPNIAAIHGLDEADGTLFLVLELVEGEDLALRLKRGAVPLAETLAIGKQIAEALEEAHDKGIVHRDLKPANVKLTVDGKVKVLDFGLAKAYASDASGGGTFDSGNSPTMTHAATMAGMILGTAAYMSPEQARGKTVDKRADIWAFGCVLFECLTGRQAFDGETVSDMIARILQGEPEWSALPARTPERVRGLLRRCLEKDARRRLRDIGDARMEIEDVQSIGASGSSIAAAGATALGSRRRIEWARLVGVALLAAAVTWFVPRVLHGPKEAQPTRFAIPQPEGVTLETSGGSAALSPDGRMLVFVAYDSTGESRIWLRTFESTVAKPIAGTNKADFVVFWSPDSRQIAFASEEKLRRIAVAGGDAEVVCPVKSIRGGSWSRDGVILIAPNPNSCIYRVPAGGGELQPVTTLDSSRGETAHRFPQFLPDGRHFLFSALPARSGKFDIYVGTLDSPQRQLLMSASTGVTWAPPGNLLFARDGKLMAQGFDAKALKLRGEPVSLGDAVSPSGRYGGPIASASLTGSFAYSPFQVTNQRLVWLDLTGREIAPIPLAPGQYSLGSISPDDRRVALTRNESPDQSSIWIADLERGVATRFTDEAGDSLVPWWSPDGKRIAYLWRDKGSEVVKIKSLAGDAVASFLESDTLFKQLHGWSPDGRSVLYSRLDPVTVWDLWVLPLDGDRKPHPYLQTRFNEAGASPDSNDPILSPDGRWIAYLSDESGRDEVYVQSFPAPGGEYQVTTGGGGWCFWSWDGKKLYYGLSSDSIHGYEAEIQSGSEFRLGPARMSLTFPKDAAGLLLDHTGKRVLALLPTGKGPSPSITVLLDGLPGGSRR